MEVNFDSGAFPSLTRDLIFKHPYTCPCECISPLFVRGVITHNNKEPGIPPGAKDPPPLTPHLSHKIILTTVKRLKCNHFRGEGEESDT